MRPHSVCDTFLSGTPLAYASLVPVPNVPSRDSGSRNVVKSSSLYAIGHKLYLNEMLRKFKRQLFIKILKRTYNLRFFTSIKSRSQRI
ncbi:hypothetical protein EHQ47_16685 [Leptospira bourretii]|nr:hypothetical protein EHQ47_16685 [Leptospira bourretii]